MSVLSLSGSPMVGTSWTRRLTSTWLLDDASVWRKPKKNIRHAIFVCVRARACVWCVCVCVCVCLSVFLCIHACQHTVKEESFSVKKISEFGANPESMINT